MIAPLLGEVGTRLGSWVRHAGFLGDKLVYGLPILHDMGNIYRVKTTLDIQDALLLRAKRLSKRTGQPLRAIVEEGLRRVLDPSEGAQAYVMPDRSVGARGDHNPLEGISWQELRDEIYPGVAR